MKSLPKLCLLKFEDQRIIKEEEKTIIGMENGNGMSHKIIIVP